MSEPRESADYLGECPNPKRYWNNLSIMKWMEDMPEKTTDFEPIPIDNQDGSFENQGKEGPPDDQCHVLQLLSNVEDLQISEDEPLQNEAPPAASTCSPEVLPHFEPNYFYLVYQEEKPTSLPEHNAF